MNARAIIHSFRLVTLTMLALLLTLAPFVHGHLGQPVQHGWHIHVGPLEVGGSGSAPLAAPGAQRAGSGLFAHEPPEVEVFVGPNTMRVLRIASAYIPTPAPQPWLHAGPAHALVLARQTAPGLVVHADARPTTPASRGVAGLPPPGHAPPLLLA
ncbi:hypothetical protein GALL_237560 [mine drainage metagenome]|uniref:Uncharacterized protein n=1 Tax=mine drainage metagenome TaxID=410659 RepID=A0A1J5RDQ7_9ZZZZ